MKNPFLPPAAPVQVAVAPPSFPVPPVAPRAPAVMPSAPSGHLPIPSPRSPSLGPLPPSPGQVDRVPIPAGGNANAPLAVPAPPPQAYAPVITPPPAPPVTNVGNAPQAVGPAPSQAPNDAALTATYIALRDKKKEILERHKDELEPYNLKMDEIEAVMLARLNQAGLESVRTTNGTAFKKTVTRYNVDDAEVMRGFMRDNGLDHLLSSSIKQSEMREYVEETGTLPPGIKTFSETVVQFRK